MDTETPAIYHVIAHVLVAIGCLFWTKGMYKELSARIVLAAISPAVFAMIGPMLAFIVGAPLGYAVRLLVIFGMDSSFLHVGHVLGVALVCAALLCVYVLRSYSIKQGNA